MEDVTLRLTKVICKKLKYDPISIDILFKGYRARLCITEDRDKVVEEIQKNLNKLECKFVIMKVKKIWWKQQWIVNIVVPFNRKIK